MEFPPRSLSAKTASDPVAGSSRILSVLGENHLSGLAVFGLFALLLAAAYLSIDGGLIPDDQFFHIRFIESIREHGFGAFTDFQSIHFSEIAAYQEHLIYYNFLFYLVLFPFASFSPLFLGIKLYGILAVALSLTVVYVFLRNLGARHAFLWTTFFLIVLSESGLLVRFLSARPFALAPVLLLAVLYGLHRRWYRTLFGLAFAYFYWHTATFFLPVGLATAYFLLGIYARPGMRPDWRVVAWPAAGMAVAVLSSYLVFPGVLSYLTEITLPVIMEAIRPDATSVVEGDEVYGTDFFVLLKSLFPLLGLFLIAGGYEAFQRLTNRPLRSDQVPGSRETSEEPLRLTLLLGSAVLFAISLVSLRFVDYFAYFSILYVALTFDGLKNGFEICERSTRKMLALAIIIAAAFFLLHIRSNLAAYSMSVPSYLAAEAPAEWLVAHIDPGAVIFNTDWDAFAILYHFTGDRFRFATGLEPRFLFEYDERRYSLWRHIGDSGRYCESALCETSQSDERVSLDEGDRIADALLHDFETDTVVTRTDREAFVRLMDHSPRFKKEWGDPEQSPFVIYRVLGRAPAAPR